MPDINYESLKISEIEFDDYPEFPNVKIISGFNLEGWALSDMRLEMLSQDKELVEYLVSRSING